MTVKSDKWIRQMALEKKMIEPFVEKQVRDGVISYGLSSYGYDIRVANEFKIFTNINCAIVDPKKFDPSSFVDFKGDVCIVPPNSFALARTVEYFRIPRSVITVCLGKCLCGASRVLDPDTGELVPIEIFVRERRPCVVAWNGDGFVRREVSAHLEQGVKKVHRLTTASGRTIEATENHPFLQLDRWMPLAELQAGDRIAVPRELPFFGMEELPDHEADLLGLMIADGQCRTPGSSPRYTSGDAANRSALEDAARTFGCVARPVRDMERSITNSGHRGGRMEKNRFRTWLEDMGLAVRSPDKFVPDRVFRASAPGVARFLRALFSGDGGISSGNGQIHLEYSTTSRRLARDVRHLLLRFGIVARLRRRDTASGRGAFALVVNDKEAILRFAESIGFVPGSAKAARLAGAVDHIRMRPKVKSNYDTLPREAWPLLVGAARHAGTSLGSLGFERTCPQQSVPRGMAEYVAAATLDRELSAAASPAILWDVVKTIETLGEEPVYDLSVPGCENFVTEDFVVHNSTYARCGIIVNVTPFEPEWEGTATLEISNTTPLPARIYAHEGIAQVLFFESDEICSVSYADKKGKYQKQLEVTPPRL
ncbi:MAG: dCTP deaminase [Planctomycetes bacterium]|nr:dCTP deaminase [Planctomycetota bacterium]